MRPGHGAGKFLRKVKGLVTSAPQPPKFQLSEFIAPLGEPFAGTLCSMYAGTPQAGDGGQLYEIDAITRIDPETGLWLYELCRRTKPEWSLEIGLAYGFSTVYFLAAIHANGSGTHVAVDPFQDRTWHGIGAARARLVGMEGSFQFSTETSVMALSRFLLEGRQFDLIFIDGDHRFDNALVDFTLAAQVCKLGGHIVLDDLRWLPAIQKVASFIRANRSDFAEVMSPVANIAAFRMMDADKREWKHYRSF